MCPSPVSFDPNSKFPVVIIVVPILNIIKNVIFDLLTADFQNERLDNHGTCTIAPILKLLQLIKRLTSLPCFSLHYLENVMYLF